MQKIKEEKIDDKVKKGSLFAKFFKKKEKINEEPVLFLRNNNKAQILYVKPEDNMYKIENKVFHYKPSSDWELIEGLSRKKLKIIPEWAMYPLGSSDYLDELKGEEAEVQYDMIRAVQNAETVRMFDDKKNFQINPKVAIIVGIVVIVILYFVAGK